PPAPPPARAAPPRPAPLSHRPRPAAHGTTARTVSHLWSARRPAHRASGPAPPPTLPVPSIRSPVGLCPTAGTAESHAPYTAPGARRPAPELCSPRDAIGGGWSRRAGFAPGYRHARAP